MECDLESLPALVAEGKMSKREAVERIWADMYQHPHKYGLHMREDEKSDFLLYLQERMESLFDNFEQGKILFRTYVWGFIRNTQKTWNRKKKRTSAEQETIRKSLYSSYDEARDAYYQEAVTETEGEDDTVRIKSTWHKKEREMAEKAALILALKACHEIDESLIEDVSEFTHIDKQVLQEKIDKLKKQIDYKSQQRDLIIRRRDNAFFYHRKYMIELQKLRKGTSSFARVEEKYQQQTENWLRQNKLLSHRFVLSPTNVAIAKELGMKARQVCFYISHVKKRKAPFIETADEPCETTDTDTEQPEESETTQSPSG